MAQLPTQDGVCLRYPEPLGVHAQITQETAIQMLHRATQLAQHTPFTWGYIDKPTEGQLFLIFQVPQLPLPNDGIAWQDREQRYSIPLSNGRQELEVAEIKFGFIPGIDNSAFRVRRRFRLAKGGHSQLILIHYSRGQASPIIPSLNQPVRNYPLRPVNEPPMYVMGEKQGQKVYPGGGGQGQGRASGAERPVPGEIGIGYGMPGMGMAGNPQALLAHQNSNMEALEKRGLRDRSGSMNTRQAASRGEDDDSADESESISTRTLALTRYRRNHELMNEVFMYAAFGNKNAVTPPPPYSIFKKEDVEAKVAKLNAEIEELKAKSAARRQQSLTEANEIADISMDGPSISDAVTT